jgi:hypothetical protein
MCVKGLLSRAAVSGSIKINCAIALEADSTPGCSCQPPTTTTRTPGWSAVWCVVVLAQSTRALYMSHVALIDMHCDVVVVEFISAMV